MTILLILLLTAPPQQRGEDHHAGVDRRGDTVMGFSHEMTTHHFRLRAAGGEIEVTANDPRDEAAIRQIRAHLAHVARMFAAGNFTAPLLIHAVDPPGAATMARRKGAIRYAVEEIPRGARVRIATGDAEALEAVHAFLRFQIADHRTGDPLTIQR